MKPGVGVYNNHTCLLSIVRIASCADACYLVPWPGSDSCTVEFNEGEMGHGEVLDRTYNRSLIFEPALGGSDSRCSCETIDRYQYKLKLAEYVDNYHVGVNAISEILSLTYKILHLASKYPFSMMLVTSSLPRPGHS